MATNLGAQASNAPLPTGVTLGKRASDVGTTGWPGADNFLYCDANGSTGNFNRPERFWLKAGASIIASPVNAGYWTAYVYKLRLLVNGAYNNDLNGNQSFIKYNTVEAHTDSWWGTSIEGLYYCEANTNYEVYLLSGYAGGDTYYYRSSGHMNIWAYTIGEGAY